MTNSTNATVMMHPVGKQSRIGRDDLGHARGHGDGDREDVVGHERGPGRAGRQFAEVVAGDDVGSAAAGIGVNRLFIGEGHDRQQGDDGDRDGKTAPKAIVPAAASTTSISWVA